MTKLTVTKGLPGSGKSTWAREQLREHVWRVNRDDIRAMVQNRWRHGDPDMEDTCTAAQHAMIRGLLHDGVDVIVDDTNLNPRHVEALDELAWEMSADFEIKDFTHIPLEVCITRDAARPNPVGEQVIRGMWAKYLAPAEHSGTEADSPHASK